MISSENSCLSQIEEEFLYYLVDRANLDAELKVTEIEKILDQIAGLEINSITVEIELADEAFKKNVGIFQEGQNDTLPLQDSQIRSLAARPRRKPKGKLWETELKPGPPPRICWKKKKT